ncbi:MAG: zinc ribbon domain-containing protein [Deltaproteobacteria bacterium]|nr:zinc ribbon domain-containing protein [Deltaproteobacteria bacterium]
MPIYEYRCHECGAVSEYLVGVGSDDPIKCKECGGSHLSKILSVGSFTLHASQHAAGRTCCGREERCERPPCSDGGSCRRD